MSFEYGSLDLATPEGAEGFDRYYTSLRKAVTGYYRTDTLKIAPPPIVKDVHRLLLKADNRVNEIIGDEFPAADPSGAEAFTLFFVRSSEIGSPYTRDLLGAVAIRDLCRTEPRLSPRVCRAVAGMALSNPRVIQVPSSKTMTEFMMVACNETPDSSLDISMITSLVSAYREGAFPMWQDQDGEHLAVQ